MVEYYSGTKLLSLKDINGCDPEIYMCSGNRTGGKTTFFNRLCVNKYLKTGSKFGVIYRFKNELDNCAEQFFKDIKGLFFPSYDMIAKPKCEKSYYELYLNNKHCGYALALNCADKIKRNSHLLTDIDRLIFDEFQSETNTYCPDEVTKFLSIHKSIARGQGKQHRYVPVYMISNPVTLLNPYYISMDISNRIQDDTKFLRGDGFVLECCMVESAIKAQEESGVFKAFSQHKYSAYAGQNIYLNDSKAFVEKPEGTSRYIATLKYKGKEYGVREYAELGIMYCDDRPDRSYPYKLSVTTGDHNVNYIMLKSNQMFICDMRYYFDRGCFRFKDLICKDVILTCLSY